MSYRQTRTWYFSVLKVKGGLRCDVTSLPVSESRTPEGEACFTCGNLEKNRMEPVKVTHLASTCVCVCVRNEDGRAVEKHFSFSDFVCVWVEPRRVAGLIETISSLSRQLHRLTGCVHLQEVVFYRRTPLWAADGPVRASGLSVQ